MSTALIDSKWERCLADATDMAVARGTPHGFVGFMAKALYNDERILLVDGQPETDGDLELVQSDIGPVRLVHLVFPVASLRKALPKARNTSGFFSVGRGSKKVGVRLSRVTHRPPNNAKFIHQGAPPKKSSGFEAGLEREAVESNLGRKTRLAAEGPEPSKDINDSIAALHNPKRTEVSESVVGKDTPSSTAEKPMKYHPKTGKFFSGPQEGEHWITVHPWGDERYQHVLVREIPEHRGQYLSVSGMGGRGYRFLHLTSLKKEEVSKEEARSRQEVRAQKREERKGGRTALDQRYEMERASENKQAVFAPVEKLLPSWAKNLGHDAYGFCQNEDGGPKSCKARKVVHLHDWRDIKAILLEKKGSASLSAQQDFWRRERMSFGDFLLSIVKGSSRRLQQRGDFEQIPSDKTPLSMGPQLRKHAATAENVQEMSGKVAALKRTVATAERHVERKREDVQKVIKAIERLEKDDPERAEKLRQNALVKAQDLLDQNITLTETARRAAEDLESELEAERTRLAVFKMGPSLEKPKLKTEREPEPRWVDIAKKHSGDPNALDEWTQQAPAIAAKLLDEKKHWAEVAEGLTKEATDYDTGRKTGKRNLEAIDAANKLRPLAEAAHNLASLASYAADSVANGDPGIAMKRVAQFYAKKEAAPQDINNAARIEGKAPAKRGSAPIEKPTVNLVSDEKKVIASLSPASQYQQLREKYVRSKGSDDRMPSLVIPVTDLYGTDVLDEKALKELADSVKGDVLTDEASALVARTYHPFRASTLLGIDESEIRKKLVVGNEMEGIFQGLHTVGVGVSGSAMFDRHTVSVLGQMGSAYAMVGYLQRTAPDKVAKLEEQLGNWLKTEHRERMQEAHRIFDENMLKAEELKKALAEKRPGRFGASWKELEQEQEEILALVAKAQGTLARTLGQLRAVNAITYALKRGPVDLDVALPGTRDSQISTKMMAIGAKGLQPEVDYTTSMASKNQPMVTIKKDALWKCVNPKPPIFDPKLVEQVDHIKDGFYYAENGDRIKVDQMGWLPAGITPRQLGPMFGHEWSTAQSKLRGITDAASAKKAAKDAATALALAGVDHRDARSFLLDSRFTDTKVSAVALKAYHQAVNALLPHDDYKADAKARANFTALAHGAKGELDGQDFPEHVMNTHLKNALLDAPNLQWAYRPIGQMMASGVGRSTVRDFFCSEVVGHPYDSDEGREAWKTFMGRMRKHGGEGAAVQFIQQLMRDELIRLYQKHAAASSPEGRPLSAAVRVGGAPLEHADYIDDDAFSGPLRGLRERRTFGARAEAKLERQANFVAGHLTKDQKPVGRMSGRIEMSSDKYVRQQRAIRMFKLVKRMAVLTPPGSGKTIMGLGGFLEARENGQCKRSMWCVPKRLIESGQLAGEFLKFTSPGTIRWHVPNDLEETGRASRLKAMRDDNVDVYVTTPEALREDILHMLGERAVAGAAGHIEGRGRKLDPQSRQAVLDLLEKDERDAESGQIREKTWDWRRNIVHNLFKEQGMYFDHAFVDEGHRLANRQGKAESQMSLTATAVTDGIPMFMLATASPAENDISEAYDLTRKIRPELFAPRKTGDGPRERVVDIYHKLAGMPTRSAETAAKGRGQVDVGFAEAFRREISPTVFNVPSYDDAQIESIRHEVPVRLGDHQITQLRAADNAAATAAEGVNKFKSTPEGVKALRFLHPSKFRDLPDWNPNHDRHSPEQQDRSCPQCVAQDLSGSIENLRQNKHDAIIHETEFGANAMSQKLAETVQHDKRCINPKTGKPASGVVFTERVKAAMNLADGLKRQRIEAYHLTGSTSTAEADRAIQAFKASKASGKQVILVVTPSFSYGANWPEGAWTAHYDLPDSYEQMGQREGRINRQGQDNAVLHNIRFVAHYPVKARDEKTGQEKTVLQKHALERQRERVINQKEPLAGLFEHSPVRSRDDTDLTRLLRSEEMAHA